MEKFKDMAKNMTIDEIDAQIAALKEKTKQLQQQLEALSRKNAAKGKK